MKLRQLLPLAAIGLMPLTAFASAVVVSEPEALWLLGAGGVAAAAIAVLRKRIK